MLNGDYAAELPGSGINAQETQERGAVRESQRRAGCGRVPSMQTSALRLPCSTWPGASAGFVMGVCVYGVGVGVCLCASVLISHRPAER